MIPHGMLFGAGRGALYRAFAPRRWQLHLWIWWWCAHHAPWIWRVRKKRAPVCGVVDMNGERVRVIKETGVKLHNVIELRHPRRR